jgi:hypothetical protein
MTKAHPVEEPRSLADDIIVGRADFLPASGIVEWIYGSFADSEV